MYETIPKSQALRIKDHVRVRHPDVTWAPVTIEEAGTLVRSTRLPWKWALKVLNSGGIITLTWGYMRKRVES